MAVKFVELENDSPDEKEFLFSFLKGVGFE